MENWRTELRKKNIEIFNDTLDLIDTYPLKSTEQYVIKEHDPKPGKVNGIISVGKSNTIDKALELTGVKIAILNFADFVSPGGWVLRGSSAQEESICRCTNLYPALKKEPLYSEHKSILKKVGYSFNDDIIYTKNVSIIKNAKYEVVSKKPQPMVDVITCCAPNMRYAKISNEELKKIMTRRWRNVISAAENEGVAELILGAWGCGAFKCDPEVVVAAFNEAASSTKFDGNVHFPIPPRGDNYKIFKEGIKV